MKINRKLFSSRTESLRKDRGLSVTEIAKSLNIKRQSVQKWEYGENVPSADNLYALAELFNVSMDYLVGLSDNPERR